MTSDFTPETSLQCLEKLAACYAAGGNERPLSNIVDPATPFSTPPRLYGFWPFKKHHTIQTPAGTVVTTECDQKSNLEALRMLFRTALSSETPSSRRTLEHEKAMRSAVTVALQVDTGRSKASSSQILKDQIHNGILAATSLEQLEDFITRTSTAYALSIDMAESVQKKNVDASLLATACARVAELSSVEKVQMKQFASIIRKLFDVAVVTVAQTLRAKEDATVEEKRAILQANWMVMASIFTSKFKNLPSWALRCVDLQGAASLLKAGAAIDLAHLDQGVTILLNATESARTEDDQMTFLSMLRDLKKFLDNTGERDPLHKAFLEALCHDMQETIQRLETAHSPTERSTKEKTWKVAKKALFDGLDISHKVISSSLGGAFTGALTGLITGGGLPGVAAGALGGAAAQGGTTMLTLGINPLVNQIPCSAVKKATIRHYLTSWTLPLLSFLASLRLSAWASRTFTRIPTQPSQPAAIPKEQVTFAVPRDLDVQKIISTRASDAVIQRMQDSWQTKTITVELPFNQTDTLSQVEGFTRLQAGQERTVSMIGKLWDALFAPPIPIPAGP